MKKLLVALIVATLAFGMTGVASATSIVNDEYWGNLTPPQVFKDRIGKSIFEIEQMELSLSPTGWMTVKVKTPFDETSSGALGAMYGDLFFSSDGWNPDTSLPDYTADNWATGEMWEYAFDVSAGKLYQLPAYTQNPGDPSTGTPDWLETSDEFSASIGDPWKYYRKYQEVRIDPNANDWTGTEISTGTAGRVGNYYVMSFDVSSLLTLPVFQPGTFMGVHWAMTCGNDTFEGEWDPVIPEPGTLLLLGTGLLGLLALGRKRFNK